MANIKLTEQMKIGIVIISLITSHCDFCNAYFLDVAHSFFANFRQDIEVSHEDYTSTDKYINGPNISRMPNYVENVGRITAKTTRKSINTINKEPKFSSDSIRKIVHEEKR